MVTGQSSSDLSEDVEEEETVGDPGDEDDASDEVDASGEVDENICSKSSEFTRFVEVSSSPADTALFRLSAEPGGISGPREY